MLFNNAGSPGRMTVDENFLPSEREQILRRLPRASHVLTYKLHRGLLEDEVDLLEGLILGPKK